MQRRAVLQLLLDDEPCPALARKYKVSDTTLYRWKKEFLASGEASSLLATSNRQPPSVDKPQQVPYESELDCLVRRCPVCGSAMTADGRKPRTVLTLDRSQDAGTGSWHLRSQIRRCHNESCSRYLAPYKAEIEGRIALPYQKLSLSLLKVLEPFSYATSLTSRKIQTRLSAQGINLARSTIENAMQLLSSLPRDPAIGVRGFLSRHPKQQGVLLDIFVWGTRARCSNYWIVRDCFSSEVLVIYRGSVGNLFLKLVPKLPIPVVGILCPKTGTGIPLMISRYLPHLTELELPTLQPLTLALPEVRWGTLSIPVSYWQLLQTP